MVPTLRLFLLGPDNGGAPLGIPTAPVNGLKAASASLSIGAAGIAQGTSDTTDGNLPFLRVIGTSYTQANFADAMMYQATSDTYFQGLQLERYCQHNCDW